MIKIQARSASQAEILIYDPIGANWFGDGFTAKQFVHDLAALGDVRDIMVRINSPGGEVFDGFAIYNALKNHPAQVHVQIDGLAASIASVIAMAGDLVTMGTGTMLMIHDPWSLAMGDADTMRERADMLDQVKEGILDAYASRTHMDRAELAALMAAETWLTVDDAIAQGFADERIAAAEPAAEPDSTGQARWQLAMAKYQNKPQSFNTPQNPAGSTRSAAADALPQEAHMDPKAPASVQDADNIRKAAETAALAAESARRADIRNAFGRYSDEHRELLDTCLDDNTCSLQAAQTRLLAKLAEGVEPLRAVGGSFSAGTDSGQKFINGATQALAARSGADKREMGNEFNGMSLAGLAAHALTLSGISVKGLSGDAIARKVLATHTSSDFPTLLSNVAGKALRAAYGSFPNTWQSWAMAGEVSDFKIHPRIQMGSFNNLDTIPEGGEYKYGTLTEEYENARALTKGKAIALTRQMIVNDDLGGFNRRAQLMGRSAARSVNIDVYTLLTGGAANHGPTSVDTGQFFNETAATTAGGHANLTDTGTAITTASIALGRKKMRTQKDAGNLEVLNILPKILVCSALKEDIAWAVLNSTSDPSQSNPGKKNYAADVAKLNLVTDPFLDGINSGLSWYMFADPMDVAAFEVVFLDGNQTPFIDEAIDFDTDAMKFKVRLDYGVAMGDWRAAYLNDGA